MIQHHGLQDISFIETSISLQNNQNESSPETQNS